MKKSIIAIIVVAAVAASCNKDNITPAGTAKNSTISYTPNEAALLKLNWQMEAELNESRATCDSLQKVIDDLRAKYESAE